MRSLRTASAALLVAVIVALATPWQSFATDTPGSDLPDPLRVGTEGVYPPFSYQDKGKLTGFDIEVMDAIGRELGVEIDYVETPWDSMFSALAANQFDVVANQVTFNEERDGLYDLSEPYVETTGVLVVAKDNDDIKKIEDLRGKRAGENLTSNWAEVARAAGAEVVGVDRMDEAITNLENGQVDAIVNDKLAIGNYLALNPDAGVKVVTETEDVSLSVLAARKDSGYLPALNQAITTLEANGTIEAIYDKYFTRKPQAQSSWDLIKSSIGPMLGKTVAVTIPLAALTFAIGLFLALLVALARMSSLPWLSVPARIFISVIRGTPLLLQLALAFYGPPRIGIDINPWVAAILALSLNVAGYAAEIIRSAISSVPAGQWEAASTIGMNLPTTLRRIVLPQASRIAVPPLSNTLISLVKDTSLASTILVVELFQQAKISASASLRYFELFAVAALIYWVICLALSLAQNLLEDRLNRSLLA